MRIAIISSTPKFYSTRRIRDAARARGHQVRLFNTLEFSLYIDDKEPKLYYHGKSITNYQGVVPRIGPATAHFGTAVVRQFEKLGIYTINSSEAIALARDKLRTMQVLGKNGVAIPPTVYVQKPSEIMSAIELVGGAPVIIKLLQGTQGLGVMLAETSAAAEAILETLQVAQQNALIQSFVAESKGRDVRAFVVGDRVVAAMRRTAQANEFRSNVHRGGFAEGLSLEKAYEETAIRAAQIIGLKVAGVDMLESNDGPKVMEVNSSPGLEGIEGATKVDVASAIIDYLEEQEEKVLGSPRKKNVKAIAR